MNLFCSYKENKVYFPLMSFSEQLGYICKNLFVNFLINQPEAYIQHGKIKIGKIVAWKLTFGKVRNN